MQVNTCHGSVVQVTKQMNYWHAVMSEDHRTICPDWRWDSPQMVHTNQHQHTQCEDESYKLVSLSTPSCLGCSHGIANSLNLNMPNVVSHWNLQWGTWTWKIFSLTSLSSGTGNASLPCSMLALTYYDLILSWTSATWLEQFLYAVPYSAATTYVGFVCCNYWIMLNFHKLQKMATVKKEVKEQAKTDSAKEQLSTLVVLAHYS